MSYTKGPRTFDCRPPGSPAFVPPSRHHCNQVTVTLIQFFILSKYAPHVVSNIVAVTEALIRNDLGPCSWMAIKRVGFYCPLAVPM